MKRERVPVAAPSEKELDAAFKVIDQFHLHIYQLLYFRGWTAPGYAVKAWQAPFQVSVDPKSRFGILITPTDPVYKDLMQVFVPTDFKDEIVLEKLTFIKEAIDKKLQIPSAGGTYGCCPLAQPLVRGCVCQFAWDCPIHGETHIGTHD